MVMSQPQRVDGGDDVRVSPGRGEQPENVAATVEEQARVLACCLRRGDRRWYAAQGIHLAQVVPDLAEARGEMRMIAPLLAPLSFQTAPGHQDDWPGQVDGLRHGKLLRKGRQ